MCSQSEGFALDVISLKELLNLKILPWMFHCGC
jgi:hypothetical protein